MSSRKSKRDRSLNHLLNFNSYRDQYEALDFHSSSSTSSSSSSSGRRRPRGGRGKGDGGGGGRGKNNFSANAPPTGNGSNALLRFVLDESVADPSLRVYGSAGRKAPEAKATTTATGESSQSHSSSRSPTKEEILGAQGAAAASKLKEQKRWREDELRLAYAADANAEVTWSHVFEVIHPEPVPCVICLESVCTLPRITRCGHVFCLVCVRRLLRRISGRDRFVPCPVCTDPVTPGKVYRCRFGRADGSRGFSGEGKKEEVGEEAKEEEEEEEEEEEGGGDKEVEKRGKVKRKQEKKKNEKKECFVLLRCREGELVPRIAEDSSEGEEIDVQSLCGSSSSLSSLSSSSSSSSSSLSYSSSAPPPLPPSSQRFATLLSRFPEAGGTSPRLPFARLQRATPRYKARVAREEEEEAKRLSVQAADELAAGLVDNEEATELAQILERERRAAADLGVSALREERRREREGKALAAKKKEQEEEGGEGAKGGEGAAGREFAAEEGGGEALTGTAFTNNKATEKRRGAGASSTSAATEYYFYQHESGQHLYLDSFTIKCLREQFGSYSEFPTKLRCAVARKEATRTDASSAASARQRRLPWLRHLPGGMPVEVAELDLGDVLSKSTRARLKEAFAKRRKQRQREKQRQRREEQEDKQRAERAEAEAARKYDEIAAGGGNAGAGAAAERAMALLRLSSAQRLQREEDERRAIAELLEGSPSLSGMSPGTAAAVAAAAAEEEGAQIMSPKLLGGASWGGEGRNSSVAVVSGHGYFPSLGEAHAMSAMGSKGGSSNSSNNSNSSKASPWGAASAAPTPGDSAMSSALAAAMASSSSSAAVTSEQQESSTWGSGRKGKKGKKKNKKGRLLFGTLNHRSR